jgi:hypothetical protein
MRSKSYKKFAAYLDPARLERLVSTVAQRIPHLHKKKQED